MSFAPYALELPSFAQQTGQPCATCHIGNSGPQLTPFGSAFKLGGYTLIAPDAHSIPLYDKFNGAAGNYDRFGRNAHDNNTLFIFLWMVM